MKWLVKQCPYLEAAHVGKDITGIRLDWDGELTFVNRKIVDVCLYCPNSACVFDAEKHRNQYSKGVMPLSVISKV